MYKRILLQVILCLCIGYSTQAQCPFATEATIINIQYNSGTCTFDLEINYRNITGNNSSISFTIFEDGNLIHTTGCFGSIPASNNTQVATISNLQVSCNAEVTAFYTAWNSPNCNGMSCSPAIPNNEIPLLNSLPVDLISFAGRTDTYDQIKLEWVTASEENNNRFVVEHSMDGRSFEEVGVVTGNGNTSIESYYSFVDKFPAKGENYYRLKQVDFDETFTYTEMITVAMKMDQNTSITIAPNVGEHEINLIFNDLPKDNAVVEVFSSSGINILNTSLEEGRHILELDVSTYQPGMYFVRVPIGREFVVKKFIKIAD